MQVCDLVRILLVDAGHVGTSSAYGLDCLSRLDRIRAAYIGTRIAQPPRTLQPQLLPISVNGSYVGATRVRKPANLAQGAHSFACKSLRNALTIPPLHTGSRRRPLPARSTRLHTPTVVGRRVTTPRRRPTFSAYFGCRRTPLRRRPPAPFSPATILCPCSPDNILCYGSKQARCPLRRQNLVGEEPPPAHRSLPRTATPRPRHQPAGLPARLCWRRSGASRGRVLVRQVRARRALPRLPQGRAARSGVRERRHLRVPELVSL